MIRFVDTNILVRLMTNDVPDLTQKAMNLVQNSKTNELVIIDSVLVELFFILEFNKQYKFTRDKIGVIFDGILTIPQFKVSEASKVAYELFLSNNKLDFTDCLIAISADKKLSKVVTFDKDLIETLN